MEFSYHVTHGKWEENCRTRPPVRTRESEGVLSCRGPRTLPVKVIPMPPLHLLLHAHGFSYLLHITYPDFFSKTWLYRSACSTFPLDIYFNIPKARAILHPSKPTLLCFLFPHPLLSSCRVRNPRGILVTAFSSSIMAKLSPNNVNLSLSYL